MSKLILATICLLLMSGCCGGWGLRCEEFSGVNMPQEAEHGSVNDVSVSGGWDIASQGPRQ